MRVRIALDAFGGDRHPSPEIDAALLAARDGIEVVLVGDAAVLRPKLAAKLAEAGSNASSLPVTIHHAAEAIGMDESPAKAVRAKPDASMPVCFDLVGSGEAEAVVSAGNSGAMLACGLFKAGRIKGVDRPAIATVFATPRDTCCLLDMGVNVECKALHFAQFAVMGATYTRFQYGKARPRVGVLSNGSELSKGTELTRAAHRAMSAVSSPDFDFRGYVEGQELFLDHVDVIVTDGFTGNVLLKVVEGTVGVFAVFMKQGIAHSRLSKIGAVMMKSAFSEVKARIDPDNYGGAPLLGIRQVAIVCHGRASAVALANGIRQADKFVRQGLTPGLTEAIARNAELFDLARGE